MCETEKASVNLKEKLDEAETAISLLRDEKATAACSIEKFAQDLEDALEQRTLMNTQLEALRAEHDALVRTKTEFLVETGLLDAFHSAHVYTFAILLESVFMVIEDTLTLN